MDPLPTPYDILALPALPYAPSALAWGALLVGLSALAVFVRGRRPSPPTPFQAVKQAIRELDRLAPPFTKPDLTLIASRLRHVLEVLTRQPCTALTAAEIQMLTGSGQHAELRPLANLIVTLDDARFAPDLQLHASAELKAQVIGVLNALPMEAP